MGASTRPGRRVEGRTKKEEKIKSTFFGSVSFLLFLFSWFCISCCFWGCVLVKLEGWVGGKKKNISLAFGFLLVSQ